MIDAGQRRGSAFRVAAIAIPVIAGWERGPLPHRHGRLPVPRDRKGRSAFRLGRVAIGRTSVDLWSPVRLPVGWLTTACGIGRSLRANTGQRATALRARSASSDETGSGEMMG